MIEEVLDVLMRISKTAGGARLTPVLYGGTGSGKTVRSEQYAAAHNLAFETVLLGTMLPEDILGLPRPRAGKTEWTLPDWAARAMSRPTLVLFDELDKAREETLPTILTLLASRRIRAHSLEHVHMLCAMQPVDAQEWLADETGKAISARLIFLPTGNSAIEYVGGIHGIDLSDMREPKVPLPVLKRPSARQIDWYCTFKDAIPEPLQQLVRAGIFEPEMGAWIDEQIAKSATLQRRSIVEALKRRPIDVVKRLTIAEFCSPLLADVWEYAPAAAIALMYERVCLEGSQDDLKVLLAAQQHLIDRVRASGGTLEVAAGDSLEVVVDEFDKMASRVKAVWEKRKA